MIWYELHFVRQQIGSPENFWIVQIVSVFLYRRRRIVRQAEDLNGKWDIPARHRAYGAMVKYYPVIGKILQKNGIVAACGYENDLLGF